MMKKLYKALRIIYSKVLPTPQLPELELEDDADKASEMIFNLLSSDSPCMIARFGSNELGIIINYLGIKQGKPDIFKYIKGECFDWWWYPTIIDQFQYVAGFFPPTEPNLIRFSELMLEDMKYVDLLGSWLPSEYYFKDILGDAQKVKLYHLEPYYSSNPWSRALKGKNVLVVHPFANTIEEQYHKNRHLLFENKDVLPEFNLITMPAVQTAAGESNGFENWFDALQWMKDEVDKIDYDICLIGCGAYGFPLAAHVKRRGKKAFHLGGALQLLFGIWGRRWEDDKALNGFYNSIRNEYWVTAREKPKNADLVENSCYW